MEISLQGYQEAVTTLLAAADVQAGAPVKLSANATVSACADGDAFCGVALRVDGGCATVQTAGYMRLPYTGTAPAPGYASLAANGTGGIKQAASGGRSLLVIDVDPAAQTAGVLL